MAGENNVIGLAMSLDVSDIKAGIKEVNQSIKSSKDEFNNATAGMEKWTKSSEGLNAKLKQLGTQLDGQKKIVAGYEAEIERVKNLEGDHSAELEVLKSKLLNAQTAVKKTQSSMSHYKDTLNELTKKEKEENSTLGKLQKTLTEQKNKQADLTKEYKNAVLQYGKNSNEAKDLEKQLKSLSKEIDKNENDVKSADKAFENLGKTIDDIAGKALEKSVKTFAKVGAGIAGIVGSFLATAEATREFRTNMGKVDTAFSEAGFSAKDAEKTYTEFYGILGDDGQSTEAVSHLAKLSKSQEDLAKWTDIATGVYGTFGDSLPIENLTEAANETAKTGALTGGLADALNWAGISEDKFQEKLDACNNEQERQALIQTTLTKAYSGASSKYKKANGDIIESQKAQARLSQAMADVGAQAEPLMTSIKEIGAELLEKLSPIIEKIIPLIQDNIPAISIALGTVTTALGVMSAAVMAVKIKEAALTTATIAQTTATIAQTVATKAATAGQWLLNAAMDANPIGVVILAITALVGAFILLWKNSESFRNFWIKLWDGIKKVTEITVNALVKFFTVCWDGIKKAWSSTSKFFKDIFTGIVKVFKVIPTTISNFFSDAWDLIKTIWSGVIKFHVTIVQGIIDIFKAIPSKLKEFFSTAWENIKSVWNNTTQFFKDIISNIITTFKEMPSQMLDIGKNIVQGLWNGINNAKDWVIGKIKGFTDSVIGGIKKFFGVHSPSTVTAEIGGYMAEGLANGIEDGGDKVAKAGEKVGSEFGSNFTKSANGSVNLSNTFDKLTKTIETQKSKLEGLQSQYKSAVMTFGSASREAYNLGRQIITVSRELAENEAKVKNLDDSYKNLNGTLANQMRVELNNAKNSKKALEEQANVLQQSIGEAAKKGYGSTVKLLGEQLTKVRNEIGTTNATVKELTSNLDYMAEQERKAAEEAKKLESSLNDTNNEKSLNAYEKLVAKISDQKKQLESLRTEYESAIMTFGATSDKTIELASKIKSVSDELKENENQVKILDEAYQNLRPEIDTRATWQKFIDDMDNALEISKKKLDKWSKDAGKYIKRIGQYFDYASSAAMGFVDVFAQAFDAEANAKISKLESTMEALQEQTESELSAKQELANSELSILDKMYDDMLISDVEYRDKKMAIETELANFTNQKNQEAQAQEEELMRKKDELARKQFESQKATSIAQTVINGAQAIIKGFAELGPIAGAINAGIQASLTAAQIAMIAKQQYVPALAKGGIVDGATLALVGENGKEAVMPLENNTGWINELANKISAIMQRNILGGLQNGIPAYAFANGATTVNNYYNQTINSPKSLTRREIYRDSKNLLSLKG